MLPTREQIEVAAYHRWQRRGGRHGYDRRDWLEAEQEILYALNYEVVAHYRLDGVAPRFVGSERARRCRFCEQSPPRATFSERVQALPDFLGNAALFTFEECDDCRALFRRTIEGDLERFTRPFREGRDPGESPPAPYVPIAAFKGLARAALAILPGSDLPDFEGTVEWVSNPDHRQDLRSFRDLDCGVTLLPERLPFSWAALARRIGDDLPLPSILFFVGAGRAVFQIHLPLGVRDDDLDGQELIVPRVASPFGPGRGPAEGDRIMVPLGSAEPMIGPG